MRKLIADGVRVQTCVTSPPYWGLRDYGHAGQLGLEATPDAYVAGMVEVFGLVRELLADDGTLWLNLGDSYAGTGGQTPQRGAEFANRTRGRENVCLSGRMAPTGAIKEKDLVGIPWMMAFALRADGWYLRQDIVWAKPNPMPESVTDRCTKSHEYLFLMSKRARYFYDAKAVAEPVSPSMLAQIEQGYNGSATKDYAAGGAQDPSATKANILKKYKTPDGWDTSKGNGGHGSFHKDGREAGHTGYEPKRSGNKQRKPASERGCPQDNPLNRGNQAGSVPWEGFTRNKRSVWTVGTQPYPEAHFATFPQALIEPCILAGSRPGDIVLDPFFGSGTTGQVAQALGRQWIGCELNPAYVELQDKRTAQQGLVLA